MDKLGGSTNDWMGLIVARPLLVVDGLLEFTFKAFCLHSLCVQRLVGWYVQGLAFPPSGVALLERRDCNVIVFVWVAPEAKHTIHLTLEVASGGGWAQRELLCWALKAPPCQPNGIMNTTSSLLYRPS